MDRLREWLRIPVSLQRLTLLPGWIIWLSAIILAAFTIFVAAMLYIWAFAFLVPVILIFLSTIKKGSDPSKAEKATIVKQYRELSLHVIDSWNIEQVEKTLKSLENLYLGRSSRLCKAT